MTRKVIIQGELKTTADIAMFPVHLVPTIAATTALVAWPRPGQREPDWLPSSGGAREAEGGITDTTIRTHPSQRKSTPTRAPAAVAGPTSS